MDFPSHINLSEEKRSDLVELLNDNLALAIDLYTQVKHAHWNVRGKHFISRHELFDDLSKKLRENADEIAERCAALGGYAEGTARLVSGRSKLPEFDLDAVVGDDHLKCLVKAYAKYCASFREAIDRCEELEDPITEDLFTALCREAEKDLWFLESHCIREGREESASRGSGNGRGERQVETRGENREGGAQTSEADVEEYGEEEASAHPWEDVRPPPH